MDCCLANVTILLSADENCDIAARQMIGEQAPNLK